MNKLGYQNIYFRDNKYVVQKCVRGVRFQIGTYKTLKAAIRARDKFRKIYESYVN